MSVKKILYDQDCRRSILRGVEKLARAVAVTLGPSGRTVCIDKTRWTLPPTITNDGVTVAKEINLPDPWEDMGVRLCKEVSSRTNEVSGDGTTTATVLCYTLLNESLKAIAAGHDPLGIQTGIQEASVLVQDLLEEYSHPVQTRSDIVKVATLASHDPQIGEVIAGAMEEVGRDGVVTVEDGKKIDTYLETTEGVDLQSGYLRDEFVNTDDGDCVLSNPFIVCYDGRMDSPQAVANLLNASLQKDKAPVLFFADDFSMDVLVTLAQNMKMGTISSCAVRTPHHGEKRRALLEDIAILTGGEVCSEAKGDKALFWTLEKCGTAAKVRISKRKTSVLGGDGKEDLLMARISQLRQEQASSSSEYDREKVGDRIARLSGGITVIRVGAYTEVELRQKKRSIEDALASTKSAIEEGVLPGGGSAYLHIARKVREKASTLDPGSSVRVGYEVSLAALESPFRTICRNSGYEPGVLLEKIYSLMGGGKPKMGFNVVSGEIQDLVAHGILDPKKVERTAWENSVSFATTVLRVQVALSDLHPEKEIDAVQIG